MDVAASLPGMKPGHKVRNALLGGAYLSLLSAAVLGLAPLTIGYKTWDGC